MIHVAFQLTMSAMLIATLLLDDRHLRALAAHHAAWKQEHLKKLAVYNERFSEYIVHTDINTVASARVLRELMFRDPSGVFIASDARLFGLPTDSPLIVVTGCQCAKCRTAMAEHVAACVSRWAGADIGGEHQ